MLRDQFPILQRMVNGHPLVYLDNAATTQKPQVVLDAMNDYYSKSNANVHRSVHTLAGEATEGYESCRSKLKQRYNADRAILTSGTTEAINLVAHSWGRAKLTSGDVIVLTEMEHHSDIVPWQMLAEERGVELRYVPVSQDFTLDMEAFDHALDGAALVCVVHTSNVLGVRNPLEEIIEKSRAVGARVLIDAAQGLPHSTVDFQAFGADFMAFSAHKMCGPTGIGALLVTQSAFDEMEPFMGGGDMIETVTIEGSTYQTNEHKFEAGTPRIAEAVGWTAALEWMESFDLDKEHSRLIAIASWVAEQLTGAWNECLRAAWRTRCCGCVVPTPNHQQRRYGPSSRCTRFCRTNRTSLRPTSASPPWNLWYCSCIILRLQHKGRSRSPC